MDVLSKGTLSEKSMSELRLLKRGPVAVPAAPAARAEKAADGAMQILSILQRDSRLVDFLMEDIASYSDDRVGAAVRELHDQCRDALKRHVRLDPVIDGVENTYAKAPAGSPDLVRFVGNVPMKPPEGGMLRHKGWRAARVDLPVLRTGQDAGVIAPAELEVE